MLNIIATNIFHRLKFDKIKVAKEEFDGTRKPRKIWDDNVKDKAISKLVKTKNNSKFLIG